MVEYWTDWRSPITERDLSIVAASSPEFATSALRTFHGRLNRNIEAAQVNTARSFSPVARLPRLRHLALYYATTKLGVRTKPSIVLSTDAASRTILPGTRAYVRGRADETGRVVDVTVLYSPSQAGHLIAPLTQQVFRVWSEGVPLEFVGYVGVFTAGRIGYVLSAYRASDQLAR